MATWSSSSSAADPRVLPALGGAEVRFARPAGRVVEVPLGPVPGAWGMGALLLLLVAVPGSMNLAVVVLPLLLALRRVRRIRVSRGGPLP